MVDAFTAEYDRGHFFFPPQNQLYNGKNICSYFRKCDGTDIERAACSTEFSLSNKQKVKTVNLPRAFCCVTTCPSNGLRPKQDWFS